MYGLTTTTGPAEEPIELALAKKHLRIDHDDEDTLVDAWIKAARELTEAHCSKRWVTQSVRATFDSWPGDGIIRLPIEPVTAIASVKYLDRDGTLTTISGSNYQSRLDGSPPIIAGVANYYWPAVQYGALSPVRVEFTAGYGAASAVPATVKAAMLLCLGYWDENRGNEPLLSHLSRGIPPGALALLASVSSGNYS